MNLFSFDIGTRTYPLFVAEISCNHCGSLDNVFKLIDEAKDAYADMIKIQVYTPDELTIQSDKKDFIIKKGLWKGRNLYDLYTHTQTPFEYVQPIFDYAKHVGIPIFASVFGMRGLEVLEKVNCKAYKIASFEANDIELIKAVSESKRPIIVSCGLLSNNEIGLLADEFRARDLEYMFMHCVSKYPCKTEEACLNRIKTIASITKEVAGYSDHTKGHHAAMLAVAQGAKIIEKHFHNPKYGESEDKTFSLSPASFKRMVLKTRNAYRSCIEIPMRGTEPAFQFRRSIYVIKDIKKGQVFSEKNIASIRPSYGLEPHLLKNVLKNISTCDIEAGTPLKGDMVQWTSKGKI